MIPEDLKGNSTAAAFDDLAATAKFEFAELTIEVEPAKFWMRCAAPDTS